MELQHRYQLGPEIGSGGMSTVYSAEDTRLGRTVAVKVLKRELMRDEEFTERFRREARSVARLSHPNIATVYDYWAEDDMHCIVMELVQGRDLAEVLAAESRLAPERAARIAARVCSALDKAHAAGVVHRDIKPANVIVGAGDEVKVTDFGIARTLGDGTLTSAGSLVGSPNYLSPEQATGAGIGPQSDLYSLGIVFFEMLTGTLPFTGDSALGIALARLSAEVPAPSAVDPELPGWVDDVTRRATARRPEGRYRNAVDMKADLMAPRAEPEHTRRVAPEPASQPPPAKPTGRKRAVLVGLVLGVFLAAAAAYFVPQLLSGGSGGDTSSAGSRDSGGASGHGSSGNHGSKGGGQASPSSPTPLPEQTLAPTGTPPPGSSSEALRSGVIGAPADQVADILRGEGYYVILQPITSTEQEGTVVDTDPQTGVPLDSGDTVTLQVSAGSS